MEIVPFGAFSECEFVAFDSILFELNVNFDACKN